MRHKIKMERHRLLLLRNPGTGSECCLGKRRLKGRVGRKQLLHPDETSILFLDATQNDRGAENGVHGEPQSSNSR